MLLLLLGFVLLLLPALPMLLPLKTGAKVPCSGLSTPCILAFVLELDSREGVIAPVPPTPAALPRPAAGRGSTAAVLMLKPQVATGGFDGLLITPVFTPWCAAPRGPDIRMLLLLLLVLVKLLPEIPTTLPQLLLPLLLPLTPAAAAIPPGSFSAPTPPAQRTTGAAAAPSPLDVLCT